MTLDDTDGDPTYVSGDDGDDLLEEGETWVYTASKNITGISGQSFTNTVVINVKDDENNPATDSDTETVRIIDPSLLTNTEYCSFDYDPALAGNQFRLLYHIEAAPNIYRLNSTNPGQFYYNVILTGAPGEAINTRLDIPYPFVTHGANPIHVYSDYDIHTNAYGYCLTPIGDVSSAFTIDTENGYKSASGYEIIRLSDYETKLGSTEWITVQGVIPASGFAYITVHLEYGLIKTSGWTKNGETANSASLGVTLTEPQGYAFSFVDNGPDLGGVSDGETGQSVNEWKKAAGVMGFVNKAVDNSAKTGAKVQLFSPSNQLIETQYTDADGYYFFNHKHSGKNAYYKVKLFKENGALYQTQQVLLKANGFSAANFSLGSDYLQVQSLNGVHGQAALLSESQLSTAVEQAFDYWAARGESAEEIASLRSVLDVRLVDLSGSVIGQATEDLNRIEIDRDAATFGWQNVSPVDVVAHELGHLLGHDHDEMGEFLILDDEHGHSGNDDHETGHARVVQTDAHDSIFSRPAAGESWTGGATAYSAGKRVELTSDGQSESRGRQSHLSGEEFVFAAKSSAPFGQWLGSRKIRKDAADAIWSQHADTADELPPRGTNQRVRRHARLASR